MWDWSKSYISTGEDKQKIIRRVSPAGESLVCVCEHVTGVAAKRIHWFRQKLWNYVSRAMSRAPRILARAVKWGKLLQSPGYWRGLVYGVAGGAEHEVVLQESPSCAFVDIGANKGQFSLAVRRCYPDAWIIAFEPLAGPARYFERVFRGDQRVKLHEVAIGPTPQRATMYVSNRVDSSSLLPITMRQSEIFPGTEETGTTNVVVRTLGECVAAREIESPAFLKLDVQGYELQCLRGCESELNLFAYIYVECSFVELYAGQALADEVIAWVHERGFAMQGVYNVAYDGKGKAVQADFLFKRR